jgi:hypothetical protein
VLVKESPGGGWTPRGVTQEEALLSEYSVEYGEARDQDHPHACWDGYIYLGYTDEDGEEQIEKLPCRRCSEAPAMRGTDG